MRTFVIPLNIAIVLALSAAARSDVIHLKNGDVIYADQVKENGANFEYEVGDNAFSIPKSRVQSVEGGEAQPSAPVSMAMPSLPPEASAGSNNDLLNQIVHGHEVDRSILASIVAGASSCQRDRSLLTPVC